jgi:tetratricopeptide (TPR) repeat protein
MRASPDGAAAAPTTTVSVRRPGAPAVVGGAAAGLGVAAVLAGGGASDERLALLGMASWVLAGVVLAAVAWGALPRPSLGVSGAAVVGLFAAWVAWGGVTLAWSIEPERSWDVFNRGLAYLAALALGVVAGAVVPRRAVLALAVVAGVALVWALVGKVVPALGPDVDRSARLHAPIGIWNALALLLAVALPLWTWIAGRRSHPPALRAVGVVAVCWGLVALALTASRGGVLVAVVALVVWLLLGSPRLESAVALGLAFVGALPVVAWALTRDGLTEAGAAASERRSDGLVLGLLLVAAAGVVFAIVFLAARRDARQPFGADRRRLAGRALVGAGAALALVAVAFASVRVDDFVDEFRNPPSVQVQQGSGRLTALSSNHRWTWWREAWQVWEANPVVGTGAGSFALARLPIREDTQRPLEPHNVAVQALAETGLVGFLLLLGFAAAGAWAVALALRRLDGADRAAAAALAAGLVAYAAHALIDVGYDYVAVSAPFFLVLGVLLSAGRSASDGGRSWLGAVAAVAVAATAVASLASPWLAERRLDVALDRSLAGDVAGAEDAAEGAQALNPLALRPLIMEASLAEGAGRLDEAEALFREAVELQPKNPETWYQLGRFRFEARNDPAGALLLLDRSYALDAYHRETPALLNEVRAALAGGG